MLSLANGLSVRILQTRFQIDVAYNYRDINLVAEEQAAMRFIWDKCCAAQVNASTIAAVQAADGDQLLKTWNSLHSLLVCTELSHVFT